MSRKLVLNAAGAAQGKYGKPFFTTPDKPTYNAVEDAFFLTKYGAGIADGVSGWETYRGPGHPNPALYAFKLMDYAQKALEKRLENPESMQVGIAGQVMQESYDLVCKDVDATGLLGSATALVAVLRDDELDISNLGDGGVWVLRGIGTRMRLFESTEQQLRFNTPYQLGTDRDCNKPRDAKKNVVKVKEGDIVLLASDGLFDNLWHYDITDCIGFKSGNWDPSRVAQTLLEKARSTAEDEHAGTPFGVKARAAGHAWNSGKMDDISIVVAIVTSVPTDLEDQVDSTELKGESEADQDQKNDDQKTDDSKNDDQDQKNDDQKKKNLLEPTGDESPSKRNRK